MKVFNDDPQNYYKRMLDLQEKLRKSEEERIRLEERFNILVQDSRNRHQTCVNRLRIRYVEFLEEQKARDERNNKLLGTLEKVDSSLTLMTAKTERLNVLRKHYEAYLLRVYGNQGASGSTTADSGLESQNDPRLSFNSTLLRFGPRSTPNILFTTRNDEVLRSNYETLTPDNNISKSRTIEKSSDNRRNLNKNYSLPATSSPLPRDDLPNVRRIYLSSPNYSSSWMYTDPSRDKSQKIQDDVSFYKLFNKPSDTSSSHRLTNSAHDLDSYIGKIKRLHADTLERDKQSAIEQDRSFEDFDHEQNTSGDLLNVTLSEELERPVAQEPPKKVTSATSLESFRRPQSAYTNFSIDKPSTRASALSEAKSVVQPNVKLAQALENNPKITSSQLQESIVDDDVEDGIEDDYDDSVDIDSWMPDDRERDDDDNDQLQQQIQEMRLHERPRRKLEAIEEVDQPEEESLVVDKSFNEQPSASVSQPADQLAEDYAQLPKESETGEPLVHADYQNQQQDTNGEQIRQDEYYQQQIVDYPEAQQMYQQNNNEDPQQQQQLEPIPQTTEGELYTQEQYAGEQYIQGDAGNQQPVYGYEGNEYQYQTEYGDQQQLDPQQQQGYYDPQYETDYMNMEGQYSQEGYDPNQAEMYQNAQQPGQETDYQYQYYNEEYQTGQDSEQVLQDPAFANTEVNEMGYEYNAVVQETDETSRMSEQANNPITKPTSSSSLADDESARKSIEGGQMETSEIQKSKSNNNNKSNSVGQDGATTSGKKTATKKKDPIKSILDSDSESLIEHKLSNSESDFDFN